MPISTNKCKIDKKQVFGEIKTEITFQCPICFAMETLFFEQGQLIPTRNWRQTDQGIFHHNCNKPCQPIDNSRRRIMISTNPTDKILIRLSTEKNIKMSQIAAVLGVNRITVKRWLEGKCYPNSTSRKKLLHYAELLLKDHQT